MVQIGKHASNASHDGSETDNRVQRSNHLRQLDGGDAATKMAKTSPIVDRHNRQKVQKLKGLVRCPENETSSLAKGRIHCGGRGKRLRVRYRNKHVPAIADCAIEV